jgi:hypothetical protein
MKKTTILSTDDNENYISYLPYIQQAWNTLGWDTLTFYLGSKNIPSTKKNQIIKINPITGYRDCTVVQVSRLLAYKYIQEGIIMTSDVDMMPLSNYWNPQYDQITCYGYDLTHFQQIPMCYIAANSNNWKSLIQSDSIESLLDQTSFGKSNNFNEWWFTDQLIITNKILEYTQKPVFINRGFSTNNLAKGRIDRVAWDLTKNEDSLKIDAHMPRPFDYNSCIDLINNTLHKT